MVNTSTREVCLSSLLNIKMQDKWDLLAEEAAAGQVRTLRGTESKRKGDGDQGSRDIQANERENQQ